MTIDATEGRGCSHCVEGTPMAWFQRPGGVVRLCMGCLMDWFPGKSVQWLEERLDHYTDHVAYRMALGGWKERRRLKATVDPMPVPKDFTAPVPPLTKGGRTAT